MGDGSLPPDSLCLGFARGGTVFEGGGVGEDLGKHSPLKFIQLATCVDIIEFISDNLNDRKTQTHKAGGGVGEE